MNNEQALEQFFTPQENAEDAFVKIVFDVDYGFEKNLPKHILANFDEVERELARSLEKYRALVVTEETLPAAKATCANLAKLIAAIEEERKAVKREWNKPYAEFESRIKKLTAMIDEARNVPYAQIKAFEEKEKAAKMEAVRAVYGEVVTEKVDRWIGFEKVFDERYLNKTYKIDAVRKDMQEKIDKYDGDLTFICENAGSHLDVALFQYGYTLSLTAAMRAVKDAEAREKETEALAGRQSQTEEAQKAEETEYEAKVYTVDFRVFATSKQLSALKEFMKKNGIKYGKVPKGEE